MNKIRAEFYNNLIDRILDSKLEAETRLEEELVEKIFFCYKYSCRKARWF